MANGDGVAGNPTVDFGSVSLANLSDGANVNTLDGNQTITGAKVFTGGISFQAGTGGSNIKPSGLFVSHVSSAGTPNSGTSETNLYNDSLPANTVLPSVGGVVVARYAGTFFNSTSTKQLRVYFGSTPTLIYDSGALATTATTSWDVDLLIVRNASQWDCTVRGRATGTTTAPPDATYTAVATTAHATNAMTLKITGTAAGAGAASNDILPKNGIVELKTF